MIDVLHSLVDNMVVAIVLIVFGAWLLAMIAGEIRKYGCHRLDVGFKRELVDRGLAADEIERIVASQPAEREDKPVTVIGNNYAAAPAATNS
jgi:hypothetical protein